MKRKATKSCESHLYSQKIADDATHEAFKIIDAENEIIDEKSLFNSTMNQIDQMIMNDFK